MNKLTIELVSGTDNDFDANVEAFTAAYLARVEGRDLHNEKIAAAIEAVFDEMPHAIKMDPLVSFALNKLDIQNRPNDFKVLKEGVLNYLRANSQGKKISDGVYERPDSLFVIQKGQGTNAGCMRRSDIKVKAE